MTVTDPADVVGRPLEELPTPAVLVDLPTVRRNIARMAGVARGFGVALRPHWKTSKSAEVARMQLEAGAVGLTAATAGEVEALVAAGVPDVFWAYPPVGPHRVATALGAARRARLIVGVDSLASARPLAEAAAAQGVEVEVRLEVDTGLGRTGVDPEEAPAVARDLADLPGLVLEGIFTHEGHVQALGPDPERRLEVGTAAGRLLADVADRLRADGLEVGSVSVGSTAGSRSAPSADGVTEARPGTYVYGDENQVAIGTIDPADTATSVLSRVVSTQRGEPVVVDAGIKAMSSDPSMHGDGRIGTVVTDGGGVLAKGYEEHGVLGGAAPLQVGDLVRFRPNHACGLTNMHSHVLVVDGGVVVDVWPVLGRH
ncbi:alanine racemase [Georgenia sp. Z1344]|uniref:alanine racemase n=1 Tax=Georgenia sp. Z1344 TaxID=3416706 RepID=UPI003CF4E65C